jgi:V8-like Glu-specific endopeptidase
MVTRVGLANLRAPIRLALLTLLCVLALPIAQLAAQMTEEERAAALERLGSQLTVEGASGRIVERTPGSFDFVPDNEPLVLPIANPDRIASAAVGPLLKVYGNLDADSGDIQLRDYQIEFAPLPTGPQLESIRSLDPLMSELDTLLSGFAAKVNQALKPGAMSAEDVDPEGGGPIAVEDRRTTEQLTDLYARAVEAGDTQARNEIVESYAKVRQQLKAIYDTYDNYPPWSYEQIYRNAGAVVAIGVPGASQAICSGVLVGQDLVLTAGHCFKSDLPDELEVWFDFIQDQEGVRDPQTRRISELVAPSRDKHDAFFDQSFGRNLYDYAIVRFVQGENDERLIPRVSLPSCQVEPAESPPDDAAPEIQAQWQDMRDEWQARCIRSPQCLRDARVRRGRPLYVVGYPKGTRETVHDNGRVYLPYQLTSNDFDELKLEIEADYKEHPERESILKEFTDSYVQRPPRYFLEDVRYGGQPKIGIVADTFRGNSGSPVYDRDDHCLVGMLIGGAEDRGERLLASWQHHEAVLPVSAILNDLGQHEDTRVLVEQGLLQTR